MWFMSTDAIADVILSAPGDPSANTSPSGDRAHVGAMFDSNRVPACNTCNPSVVSSSSPSELLSPNPVPGITAPEPYPADAVMAHARPVSSTAEACTVDGGTMHRSDVAEIGQLQQFI